MLKKLIFLSALIAIISSCNVSAQRPDAKKQELAEPNGELISPPVLPDKADFCGEQVPLHYFDVRESLQRELTSICFWHSSTIYTIQLSRRYLGIIERILKENGVPDDLKYLCIAESNLQNVVSPARAEGFWQLLSGTAKDFGLEVSSEIDERYHLEKATVAACQYLKGAYKKYGNWTLAAASYNVGQGHISQQLARQKTNSYYDLHLNTETARYVFRAVAYKTILQNPGKYGYNVPLTGFDPLEYKEVKVSGAVDWIDFALQQGTNYKMLRYFNPWIRGPILTNKARKTYKVAIPAKGSR